LYSLLGTIYGGDGRTSFALPDLRGRTPVHAGRSDIGDIDFRIGQRTGAETHTLSPNEMPQHTHTLRASSAPANAGSPANNLLAASNLPEAYRETSTLAAMAPRKLIDRGRQPGPRKHAALDRGELLHRAAGPVSFAQLTESDHVRPLSRRNPDVRRQLRAARLGLLRRPAAGGLAERRAVFAARDDLRRRRSHHLRPARHARPPADSRRHGTRAEPTAGWARVPASKVVTLTVNQLPAHSHPIQASVDAANGPNPEGEVLAEVVTDRVYRNADDTALSSSALTAAGGSRSHTNLMPFLCVNFIIALAGVYPSRS
jgi:microcystin-dependent protein